MLISREFIGSEKDWDDFVLASSGSNVHHQSGWLNILVNNHKMDLIRLGLYENEMLVGVLPLFVKKYGFIRIASSPFYVEDTPYLGYVGDTLKINEVTLSIHNYMIKNNINFVRIVQEREYDDIDTNKFLILIKKHTHILCLDNPENVLWKNLEGRCRTAIRKAEKNGIEVDYVADVNAMKEYYEILSDVYVRQELIYPHPLQFFLDIFEKYNGNQLYMLLGKLDGKVIAGGIFMVGSETVYYLNGASLKDFNNTGVNNLIQWKSILHASELGKKYYDFVGSDMERFGKFKKSFGGDLHSYVCLELTKSPLTGIIRKFYPKIKVLIMKYFKIWL